MTLIKKPEPISDDDFKSIMIQITIEELVVMLNGFDIRSYPPCYHAHYLHKRDMMAEVFHRRTGLQLPEYQQPPSVLEGASGA